MLAVVFPSDVIWSYTVFTLVCVAGIATIFLRGDWQKARGIDKLKVCRSQVPAVTHGDTVVTECAAICAYLADAFPQAELGVHVADGLASFAM